MSVKHITVELEEWIREQIRISSDNVKLCESDHEIAMQWACRESAMKEILKRAVTE